VPISEQRVRALIGTPSTEPDFLEGVELFGKSAISAAGPELIGLDPLEGVDKFRQRNPALGLTSELLGEGATFLVPFLRPVQAASKALPLVSSLFRGAEAAAKAGRPVRATVLETTGALLPFEAGRVALAATLGEDPAGVAGDAALDLALIGGGAGLLKGFTQAIPLKRRLQSSGRKLQALLPRDINLNAVPHVQLRKLRTLRQQPHADDVRLAMDDYERDLIQHIRSQRTIPALETKHFRAFDGANGQQRSRKLESILREGGFRVNVVGRGGIKDENIRASMLASILETFPHQALRRSADEIERLGPGFEGRLEEFTQFLRVVQPGTDPKAKKLLTQLQESMGPTRGQNLFVTKERNEGLFVMAKKFRGDPHKTGAADEWVIFKTDRPELFAPGSYAGFSRNVKMNAFGPIEAQIRTAEKMSVPIYREFVDILEATSTREFLGEAVRNPKAMGPMLSAMLERSASPELRTLAQEIGQAGLNSGRFLKMFVSPTLAQFTASPRASALWGAARYAFSRAEQRAAEIVFGVPKFALGQSAVRTLLGKVEREGGLDDIMKGFTDRDLVDVNVIFVKRLPLEAVESGAYSEGVKSLFRRLQGLDVEFNRRLGILQGLGDGGKFVPLPGHYMLSRAWRGDFRIAVRKVNPDGTRGDVVWVASGRDKASAVREANEITEQLGAQGMPVRWQDRDFMKVSVLGTRSFAEELNLAAQINMSSDEFLRASNLAAESLRVGGSPAFLKEAKGVQGFMGSTEPMTLREFRELVQRNIFARERLIADNMVRKDGLYTSELSKLRGEEPELERQLQERLNDLSGQLGPVAKLIESYVDKPLEPFLGRNGASKIFRQSNRLMFQWTLGMGNLGFPLLNAATTIQTSMPELAYVLNAPIQVLQRHYTTVPLIGKDGVIRGSASVLEPLKILRQSFKELAGADKYLIADIARGMREGALDPRFAEEFVGQKSSLGVLMRSSFGKDSEGFLAGVEAISSYLPARTEVLARGHSFVLGRIAGRDFHGLEGEALYQFAKQFTDRTMFLYTAADRSRLMQGAVGSTLGLFKNWSSHYIANFMLYTNEGVQRANWAPLLWQMAGTGVLAGAGGIPGYSLMDGAVEAFSDKSMIEQTYNGFGYRREAEDLLGEDVTGALMDGMFYGLPGFAGISLQGSAAAPGSDLGRDVSMLYSFALMDRASALGKAIGGMMDQWSATGTSPMASSRTRDQFFRALAPRTMYKAMQALEDRSLRSLNTGNKLLSDVSLGQGALFALGLTPTDIQRRFETSGLLWRRQDELRSRISELGSAWAEAEREGDSRMLQVVAREASMDGIMDSVLRSAKARRAKQETDLIERQMDDARARATVKALAFTR